MSERHKVEPLQLCVTPTALHRHTVLYRTRTGTRARIPTHLVSMATKSSQWRAMTRRKSEVGGKSLSFSMGSSAAAAAAGGTAMQGSPGTGGQCRSSRCFSVERQAARVHVISLPSMALKLHSRRQGGRAGQTPPMPTLPPQPTPPGKLTAIRIHRGAAAALVLLEELLALRAGVGTRREGWVYDAGSGR